MKYPERYKLSLQHFKTKSVASCMCTVPNYKFLIKCLSSRIWCSFHNFSQNFSNLTEFLIIFIKTKKTFCFLFLLKWNSKAFHSQATVKPRVRINGLHLTICKAASKVSSKLQRESQEVNFWILQVFAYDVETLCMLGEILQSK